MTQTTGRLRPPALAALLLLAVVAVWGSTFVLVKDALRDASPLLFNLLRMTVASAALVLVNWRELRRLSRASLRAGALTGVLLGTGYQLQTAGLARTSAINSAFLTGLVVVLVPLLSFLPALRRPDLARPGLPSLLGAATAFAGLVLLTTPAGLRSGQMFGAVRLGDALTFCCAVAFAGHLLALSRVAPLGAQKIATLQVVFATLLMGVTLPLSPGLHLHWTQRLVAALLVTGLLATAAAFSIQTWSQQHLSATSTALLLTLEPVFALLFSMLFLGERLSLRGFAGSALILAGIAATELLSLRRPLTIPAA